MRFSRGVRFSGTDVSDTSGYSTTSGYAPLSTSIVESITIAVSDEITNITTGMAKITWRAPRNMTLSAIPRASLATASTSGEVTFDINKNGTSILGANKLSIDQDEKTSVTAATATTLATTSITSDDEITIDVDASGTGAKGAKITIFYDTPITN